MDTAFYYYTSKGQKKGPYKFYQLQQLKTEEQVSERDFNPAEWKDFVTFVETGDMGTTRFIRKVEEQTAAVKKESSVLRLLTYVSYTVALLFIIQGLIQGQNDYLMRSQPAFYLGLIAAVALCHMIVDKAVRTRLSRNLQSSSLAVLVWFIGGLIPLAAIIAVAMAIQQVVKIESISASQVIDVGTKYMAAGALLSIYRPFYLRTIAIDTKLLERKPWGLSWLIGLTLSLGLAGLYIAPMNILPGVGQDAREYLFSGRSRVVADSKLTWQYAVCLGDSARTVERTLGVPQEKIGREYVYRSAGVRVMFDAEQHVSKIRFTSDEKATSYKTPILAGISAASNLQQVQSVLDTPPATFSESTTDTSVWVESPYKVMGCFWKTDTTKNGKSYKAGDLKWIEITLAE